MPALKYDPVPLDQHSHANAESVPLTAQPPTPSYDPNKRLDFSQWAQVPADDGYQGAGAGERSPAFQPIDPLHPLHLELHGKDQKLKYIIRHIRLVFRALTTILAIAITVLEGLTLHSFIVSHNVLRPTPVSTSPRGPWSLHTQLWSSILLFAMAVITSFLGLCTLVAYLVSVRAANKVHEANTKLGIAELVVHGIIWLGITTAYREAKNGEQDLWGWSCGATAGKIQGSFEGVVDFHDVCTRSAVNFGFSIASVVVQICGLGIWILVLWRRRTKEWLDEVRRVRKV